MRDVKVLGARITWLTILGVFVVICILAILSLGGCTNIRSNLIDVTEEDLANRDTAIQAATNLIKAWDIKSRFIRISLGDHMPLQMIKAIDALDNIRTTWEQNGALVTGAMAGEILGHHANLVTGVAREFLKVAAPDVLDMLITMVGG